MNNKLDGMSMNIEQTELDKLRSLFPQCFAEGKLDIDKLLSLCGEYIDNDFEKYKFEWKGKSECLRLAQKRSMGTLRPCVEESVNFDTTQNLYIEGDNLEVLKLLQTAYYRRVKMIYIDPPYNTGNDFVYEDDFADPIAKYKEVTAQTTKSNPETMGRYHTNWLNMMYPRLRLAANLLRDDGIIFISIDDNEVHNLRKLCDEVFGEENFVGVILWKKKTNGNNMGLIPPVHDYIAAYAKQIDNITDMGYELTKEFLEKNYSNPDNDPRGPWTTMDLSANHKGPYFAITNPATGEEFLPPEGRYWVFNEEEVKRRIADGRIIFGKTGKTRPVQKVFALERNTGKIRAESWWDNHGMNEDATAEIKNLLCHPKLFTHPKPVKPIYHLAKISTSADDIILDFFSGSATTAHAVMQLNAEDGGNRRFIMVQLPELCDENSEAYKAGYINICEIGKERIRRAGAQLLERGVSKTTMEKLSEEVFQPTLIADGMIEQGSIAEYQIKTDTRKNLQLDIGFKVFKLDSSNLKTWDTTPVDMDSPEQMDILTQRMNDMIDTIKPDRSDMDMIYEIMLKMGVPLTYSVTPVEICGKTAYSIGDECLLVSLQEGLTTEIIEQMADRYVPSKMILSEKCFADDTAMSNIHYILKDRKIELKLV